MVYFSGNEYNNLTSNVKIALYTNNPCRNNSICIFYCFKDIRTFFVGGERGFTEGPTKYCYMSKRILVADDHSLIRKGVKLLLQDHFKHKCITEASSCNALMQTLQKKEYTHLVLDLILSDGTSLEVIPNIRQLYPALKIMVFSMLSAEVYGEALKQYGINYYLVKTADEDEMVQFLDAFLNEKAAPAIPDSGKNTKNNPFVLLSARELEVLHYIFTGYGTKEISNILNLRMSTISTIKGRIFEKTNTKNIKELIQLGALYNINYM